MVAQWVRPRYVLFQPEGAASGHPFQGFAFGRFGIQQGREARVQCGQHATPARRMETLRGVSSWGSILQSIMNYSSVLLILSALGTLAGGAAGVDAQSANKLTPVPIHAVTIQDSFWSPKRQVWQDVTLRDAFDKFENDRGGALNNFDRVRDGKLDGHAGPPWYDGLIYEMIRGAADFLAAHPDPELERRLDGYIARIAAAQDRDPDGYLNTWTQLLHPTQRWGLNGGNDGYQHEMYNVGALCDAAMHYYDATGKTALLKVAVKLANYTCDQVGPAPKHELVPNHAIAEEAFGNFYLFFRAHPELRSALGQPVVEQRYLDLAQYWVEARGHARKDQPSYGPYNQDHASVFEQPTIEGHAVRAALLFAGVAALAGINGREDYRDTAIRLWADMEGKKTYITGGIGATSEGEAFGKDYYLPNEGYLETCGAVGAGFFDHNLNLLTGEARYVDALERELYNGALAGVSLAGNTYTYVNPLQAGNGNARWAWHGCPCCPPMFLKLMGALPGYIYAQDAAGIYVNLYVGSTAKIQGATRTVRLQQTTEYPWNGDVQIKVLATKGGPFDLHLRIPGWCEGSTAPEDLYQAEPHPRSGGAHLKVNGKPVTTFTIEHGYATLHRAWKSGEVVQLTLDMPVQRIRANEQVAADRGRVALMRGPVVYCFEGADNGAAVQNLVLPPDTAFTPEYRREVLGGVTVLRAKATALFHTGRDQVTPQPFDVTATPFYANANRGACPMEVWLPATPEGAKAQGQE